jgi:hypothetical protein
MFEFRFLTPLPLGAADDPSALARRLDRLADIELQFGHHVAAERLAHRAVELRTEVSA